MAKRRASGDGSIGKHKNRRWEDCYSTGYDPETGKHIFKNVLGKAQDELKEKLKKRLTIPERSTSGTPKGPRGKLGADLV